VRVFLDTNVLVSAFATRGLCADLFRAILLEHELLVGEVVLVELRRILKDKIRLPTTTIDEVEKFLSEQTLVPKPPRHLSVGLRDRDDEWVVASAVAGGADVLVTGDIRLQQLTHPQLQIVSPRGLWDLLRQGRPRE
jgi:putative PIN family toxin of toxin-antitoxin system